MRNDFTYACTSIHVIFSAHKLDDFYPGIQSQNNQSEREGGQSPHRTRELNSRIHVGETMGRRSYSKTTTQKRKVRTKRSGEDEGKLSFKRWAALMPSLPSGPVSPPMSENRRRGS